MALDKPGRVEISKLTGETEATGFLIKMITVAECRKILNKGERKYTDNEIEQIRDFLWEIAQIEVRNLEESESDENGSFNESGQQ